MCLMQDNNFWLTVYSYSASVEFLATKFLSGLIYLNHKTLENFSGS